ncbi:MAG: Gfo/Idh/MocA family oxidoreductase [Phycisphaerales bacterium]|nr:Gfo/Idh/MocA family oxidoreductase [Phycisphaerales bacterium]
MSNLLPVAVFGAGHMGRHHIRLYSQMPGVKLVAVIDPSVDRARALAEPVGAKWAAQWSPELCDLAAATIAAPTVRHLDVARPLLERGIHLLIEKPLAPDVTSAEAIATLARRHNAVVHVGHTERFNPAVLAVGRLGVRPGFVETQRISPFTFRSADIGVVFDMMIHDIDVTLSMIREPVERVDAVGVAVLGPYEDVCNARVVFAGGAVATLTASRLALKTERKLRAFAPNAYISLDYQKKIGVAITKDRNLDILKLARERNFEDLSQLAGVDFGKMVQVEPLTVESRDALETEIQTFIQSVRVRSDSAAQPPEFTAADVEDGVAAVRLASRIVERVAEHRWAEAPV